jgi:hypothetical protein
LAARNQSSQRRAAIDAIHSPPPLTAASNDVARYQTSTNVASVTDDAASEQPSQAAAARLTGASSRLSRGVAVFVDESAEYVDPLDCGFGGGLSLDEGQAAGPDRRLQIEAAMGPNAVVVAQVLDEHAT